jgi:enoyl-CoA hydratase
LLAETEALLQEVVAQSSTAVSLTWEAMHRGLNLTLKESTLFGADYFGLVASSDEFRQRTTSFLKK